MRCFMPGMLERGYGNIINISSIHSEMSMPGYLVYAGTKGAMNAAARGMALDYARKGIRVNNICPGLIISDSLKDEIAGYPEGSERAAGSHAAAGAGEDGGHRQCGAVPGK